MVVEVAAARKPPSAVNVEWGDLADRPFAASDAPDLLIEDLRTFFRGLR
jgi:hypothetical protein